MTPKEIVETRFPTIGDIANDPVFIEKATEYFEKKKHERETRPAVGKGKKYRRDLFDTFLDSGEEFVPAVVNVWAKVSKQSSAVRVYLRAAGDAIFEETVMYYFKQEKEKTDEQHRD